MTSEKQSSFTSRLGIEQLVYVGNMHNEVMKMEEEIDHISRGLGLLKISKASLREIKLLQGFSYIKTPLLHGLYVSYLKMCALSYNGAVLLPLALEPSENPASCQSPLADRFHQSWNARINSAGVRICTLRCRWRSNKCLSPDTTPYIFPAARSQGRDCRLGRA